MLQRWIGAASLVLAAFFFAYNPKLLYSRAFRAESLLLALRTIRKSASRMVAYRALFWFDGGMEEPKKTRDKKYELLRGRLGTLEGLMKAQTAVMERLASRVESVQMSEGMSDRRLDAIGALGKVLESLAQAQANSQKHTAQLLDSMLERAGRNVMKTAAQEMASKSVAVRRAKKIAQTVPEVPSFTSSCEECTALLAGRTASHTDDMLKHASEGHLMRLRQQGLVSFQ